jgi:colanic acid/amylovoran biosynthesis glycosyltransferase
MCDPRTLILFTTAFPFGKGEPFLETELPFLAARFRHVIVVPTQIKAGRRPLPAGVEVDVSLAESRPGGLAIVAQSAVRAAMSPAWYRELAAHARPLSHWRALERAMRYWGDARRTGRWLEAAMAARGLGPTEVLLYTYWLGRQTLGCGMAKSRMPGLTLVTRAHGSDLYPTAHHPPYLPFRQATLGGADRIFTVSQHGRRYLDHAHPDTAERVEVARLGVMDPGFLNPGSVDGVFRVVSCSFMEKLKRLDKLIAALRELSSLRPELRLHWHHLGDGPQRAALEEAARDLLPANVAWTFHGHLPNAGVLAFYRDHPVDAFVNVSASEGVPVSIMEALACGIPVVAPAIGGIPELVSTANGALLRADPEVPAIAAHLGALAPDRAEAARRAVARQTWQAMARADRQYAAFADRLADQAPAARRGAGGQAAS